MSGSVVDLSGGEVELPNPLVVGTKLVADYLRGRGGWWTTRRQSRGRALEGPTEGRRVERAACGCGPDAWTGEADPGYLADVSSVRSAAVGSAPASSR